MSRPEARRLDLALPLWTISIIATLFFLRAAAQLLIPIVIALLLSYMLEPIVKWLVQHRVPRLVATSLIMLTLLGALAWGIFSLRDDVSAAIDGLPDAARRVREMLASQTDSGPAASIQEAAQELSGGSGPGNAGGASDPRRQAGNENQGATPPSDAQAAGVQPSGQLGQGAATLLQRGVGSIVALAGHVTVIVFLVFFLLLAGNHLRTRAIEIAGREEERRQP